jgi:hypothetical protein
MTDTDPILVEHESGQINVEFWNFCAYPGCEARRAKWLDTGTSPATSASATTSIYCLEHTLEKQDRLSTIVDRHTEPNAEPTGESP